MRVRHQGIVERKPNPNRPRTIQTPNQIQIAAGQFLISKIDARNGACGIIPPDLDGAIVTQDFPVFDLGEAVAREYIDHIVDSPVFWRLCESVSDGTTNRVRLDLGLFDLLEFPLPPLQEQRAIAAVLDSIDETIERSEAVIAVTEGLRDALLHELLNRGVPGWHTQWKEVPGLGTMPAGWEVVKLGDVAEINPRRPSLNITHETPVTFLPMAAIAENCAGILSREHRPYREVAKGYTYFEENEILFAKITPCLQNGKHTLATGLCRGFGFGTTEFHVMRAGARLDNRHLFRVLTQQHVIDSCVRSFRGTAGQQRVQPDNLKVIPVRVPPLPEQQAIATALDSVDEVIGDTRKETDMLKCLKESAAAALLTGRVADVGRCRQSGLAKGNIDILGGVNTSMRIFISHSSSDIEIAKLLIELLEKALNLRGDDIRCTSVDGYRMPAGVSIDQRLRAEVHEAELVIGLITPNSMKSAYVSFELGARWGAEKPMIPLLASGANIEHLGGPLAGINVLDCCNESQVHQLVEEASEHLKVVLNRSSSYAVTVNSLVQMSSESRAIVEHQPTAADNPQLSEDAKTLLAEAAKDNYGMIRKIRMLGGLAIMANGKAFAEMGNRRSEARWEGALNDLLNLGLVKNLGGKGQAFESRTKV